MDGYKNIVGAPIYAPPQAVAEEASLAGKIAKFEYLNNRLADIVAQAETFADRLGGARGIGGVDAKAHPTPVPNGAVEVLGDLADRLNMSLNRLSSAMERTASALG